MWKKCHFVSSLVSRNKLQCKGIVYSCHIRRTRSNAGANCSIISLGIVSLNGNACKAALTEWSKTNNGNLVGIEKIRHRLKSVSLLISINGHFIFKKIP